MASSSRTRALLAGIGLTAAAGSLITAGRMTPVLADTSAGNTTANVNVTSSITLAGLPTSFTLTGSPGQVATTGATPVTMTVTTNNQAGYSVTVEPAAADLTGTAGNPEVIAATALEVNGPAQGGTFAHLTFPGALEVARKTSPSAAGGDSVTNDYRITIPFVRPDTYTGTLNYVATTL